MNFTLTARHFKAQDSIKDFTKKELEKLQKYYDGIIKCEVILSRENSMNSLKTAEVVVKVNNHQTFTSKEKSDDFKVSIESAVDKLIIQLKKFKDKLKSNHSTERIPGAADIEK